MYDGKIDIYGTWTLIAGAYVGGLVPPALRATKGGGVPKKKKKERERERIKRLRKGKRKERGKI